MSNIIQFYISKGDKFYVAEGVNLPVVTQGKTLDELVKNIKEATTLALERENLSELGLTSKPSLLINFEVPGAVHA
ncbi:MAG: type II toxin-antitoxin system HicB family antitoxin [bacterium]|nr:type II toxin-antitoxin system HicB family antitoxin [bacterium]